VCLAPGIRTAREVRDKEEVVPSIHDTAYPRLKASITARDLMEIYMPTCEERTLAATLTPSSTGQVGFLILLKTFQRLGYFVPVHAVPRSIVEYIAIQVGTTVEPHEWPAYDASGTRRRHMAAIRAHLHVHLYDREAQRLLDMTMRTAAATKDDVADLINVGIEELIRQHWELPGFTTLRRTAQRERAAVNRTLFQQVTEAVGAESHRVLDQLFTIDETTRQAPWNRIKADPGRPTLTQLRHLVARLQWLTPLNVGAGALESLPAVKVQQFATEALSLDAARMQRLAHTKRYTFTAALVYGQVAQTLDDLGEMFIKRLRSIHHKGAAALEDYRRRQQGRTDQLLGLLYDLVSTMQQEETPETLLTTMQARVGEHPETVLDDCLAYTAYAENNYFPFLWRFYKSHRQTLFGLLDHLRLTSTSQDTAVAETWAFLRTHRTSTRDWLELPTPPLDLVWVPDKWWKLVTGTSNRTLTPQRVNRRHFEVCVFSQVMIELLSGDLCIVGSAQFADYRAQLIPWEDSTRTVAAYGRQVGLPVDSTAFVTQMRTELEDLAAAVDASFPANTAVRLVDGEPVLRRLTKRPTPGMLKTVERLIADRLEPVNILDILTDTENWLHWTQAFGPLSGQEARLEAARARYVTTAFCYGCNLGPTQTAQALQTLDRRQIAWIDQHHITEAKLDVAITTLINAYNRFTLPKFWGSGQHASADGMKWDLYEQNLLAEYHIRYGGYGGVGYYHVSDTYIALFSHFIPCGVWEAVYILDGLLKNTSDIQPEVLHADTQGQSTPVFGLAHLLGIQLMPRMRNWKDLTLFRPTRTARYRHIDPLFTDAINWELIHTHLPDMLRVVLSIQAGRLTASTLLRKLGTYTRKHRLYLAFRELGRVVRTAFLLRYLSDADLRQTIHAATNKSEAFNRFIRWVFFGGQGLIASNNRILQRKRIKYNHLVANCVIFHNVHAQTQVLHQLAQEGYVIEAEVLARLSPYLTAHVNRFGRYALDFQREMPPPDYTLYLPSLAA
jgi:TnpA family transposase